MTPRIGQKVTYADEYGKEFTAKIVAILRDHNDQYLVNIEYRRADRSTGKVNSVPLNDRANHPGSNTKIACFTKQTPKKPTKSDSKKLGGDKSSDPTHS